jgi:hypothetical protein
LIFIRGFVRLTAVSSRLARHAQTRAATGPRERAIRPCGRTSLFVNFAGYEMTFPVEMVGHPIRAELFGNKRLGREAPLPKQFAHELRGRPCVAPPLHKEIENIALVVDRPLGPESFAADQDSHLVEGANARLVDDVCGEAPWRILARTSAPIALPFHRRHPTRARPVNPRHRGSLG